MSREATPWLILRKCYGKNAAVRDAAHRRVIRFANCAADEDGAWIFSMSPRRLNKLYTYNLTQIPGSKWGLTRGRKGEPGGRGILSGRGRRRRSGGFLRSRQTKYNSASYKERSRRDEGSLSLFLLLLSFFLFSVALLRLFLSRKLERREGGWTLLKHEWITKSRVHSFAPWRPRNPQKVYLSVRTIAIVYGRGLWTPILPFLYGLRSRALSLSDLFSENWWKRNKD